MHVSKEQLLNAALAYADLGYTAKAQPGPGAAGAGLADDAMGVSPGLPA